MDATCQTARGTHLTNATRCVCCQTAYCQSCAWGCPTCQFGVGLDRREAPRTPVSLDVDVDLA